MTIPNIMSKVNVIGKSFLITAALASVSFATGSGLVSGLSQICTTAKTLLGITAMALIILSGVVYALGQILGAETRARAAVWATAMLTGAIIGIIIYVVTPQIISAIMGTALTGC